MRKTPKTFLCLLSCSLLWLAACTAEDPLGNDFTGLPEEKALVSEAKDYFETNARELRTLNLSGEIENPLTRSLEEITPVWSKARKTNDKGYITCEVPLTGDIPPMAQFSKKTKNNDGSKGIITVSFSKLVIQKNKQTGAMAHFVVTFVGDKSYTERLGGMQPEADFMNDDSFSGLMFVSTESGKPIATYSCEWGKYMRMHVIRTKDMDIKTLPQSYIKLNMIPATMSSTYRMGESTEASLCGECNLWGLAGSPCERCGVVLLHEIVVTPYCTTCGGFAGRCNCFPCITCGFYACQCCIYCFSYHGGSCVVGTDACSNCGLPEYICMGRCRPTENYCFVCVGFTCFCNDPIPDDYIQNRVNDYMNRILDRVILYSIKKDIVTIRVQVPSKAEGTTTYTLNHDNEVYTLKSAVTVDIHPDLVGPALKLIVFHELRHVMLLDRVLHCGDANTLKQMYPDFHTNLYQTPGTFGERFMFAEHNQMEDTNGSDEIKNLIMQVFPEESYEFFEYGVWLGSGYKSIAYKKLPDDKKREILNYYKKINQ